MSAISVYQVKFNVEFTSQVINGFSLNRIAFLLNKMKPKIVFFLWAMMQYIVRVQEAIQNQLSEASESESS